MRYLTLAAPRAPPRAPVTHEPDIAKAFAFGAGMSFAFWATLIGLLNWLF
jgi:hypothetical protein